MFILHFAKCAHLLVNLTRKGIPFQFGLEEIAAQEDLKKALLNLPALRPIDYSSDSPVILTIDMSSIVVGFYLCQADPKNPQKQYYARFRSIPLNEQEQRFSQPKLELYGLFCMLHAYKIFIVGVRNLIVEVDARYIREMLNNPNTAPSTSVNRWIVSILPFHFELHHIPGKVHGPDGLSCRPLQPGDLSDSDDNNDFDDWVNNLYSFMHLINPVKPVTMSTSMLLTFALQESTPTAPMPFDAGADRYLDISYKAPHSEAACLTDKQLTMAYDWLNSLQRPSSILDHMFKLTLHYSGSFFVTNDTLWKRDQQGAHKWVLFHRQWTAAMEAAHNDIGHHRFYTMHALLTERC